mmetsp:Transcript_100511/g.181398  ORF Transcript_100511/g.181398 Transcript_100511/m.181398 type:complete len:1156 (+) Transcript_100511:43-3510(+)
MAVFEEDDDDEDAKAVFENSSINVESLEELRLAPNIVRGTMKLWDCFSTAAVRQEAGDSFFAALFEAAPSLEASFTNPQAAQSTKFIAALGKLVRCMGNPVALSVVVETLSFQHMSFEITPEMVRVFRTSLLEGLDRVLGQELTEEASAGLAKLIDYAGGAMIFTRTRCNSRMKILHSSWKQSHSREDDGKAAEETDQSADDGELSHSNQERGPRKQEQSESESDEDEEGEAAGAGLQNQLQKQTLPTSFVDMFQINASVMGFGKGSSTWMNDILECFDCIVSHIHIASRVQEECKILVLRLSLYGKDVVVLAQFKACLLAALRSTLAKTWTNDHEEAWTWLWDNLVRILEESMEKPKIYEVALHALMSSMSARQMFRVRKDIYTRFFEICPAGQNYFKQSNTRLHFIAERVLAMTLEWFKDPKAMVSDLSSIGLRHVGFGIPIELFTPFVTAVVQVMARHNGNEEIALEAFQWSLNLTANVLVRTIVEGSTVVMKAINVNSMKGLRKALQTAPRSKRATWLLHVQVGDQFISPLIWAIESGSLMVADAILKDLLTIRADRASYYYGADELFQKHPDIIKRLADRAPGLLPSLLDGLMWRSHRSINNGTQRRVNYFVKNMLVNSKGKFCEAIKWISASGDPKIVSHPVFALLADTLWVSIVRKQFIYSRIWNVLSLVVFVFSQELIPEMINAYGSSSSLEWTLFCCRMFSYVVGMGRLGSIHVKRAWIWSRNTMRGILAEIDTDGNGEIDYEEMKEAVHRFRQIVIEEVNKAIRRYNGDDELGAFEESKKAIANKDKTLYNRISFAVMISLAAMMSQEPMIVCANSPNWPTTQCPEATPALVYRYSIFAMISMAMHWTMLIDMSVFSTEISAFLLVIREVFAEVKQFLTALSFLLLLFGSTISISCRNCSDGGGNFADMPNAILSLFAITLSLYQGDYRDLGKDPLILACVFLFVTLAVVLLLNLLIAQLNRTYEYIYKDMLGFARLNRASLIVDAMSSCPKSRWEKFLAEVNFDQRQEFDEGDLGLPGCIQILEPASVCRQSVEMIKRYGGSVNVELPWPEDREEKDRLRHEHADADANSDRISLIEAMLQKTLQRLQRINRKKQRMASGGGSGVRSPVIGKSGFSGNLGGGSGLSSDNSSMNSEGSDFSDTSG